MSDVNGWVAPGWEGVRDAFAANLRPSERPGAVRDIGAAFAAYHRGHKVVDLWGGLADKDAGEPWREDTIATVYSTTKGATAICAHHLAQQGLLDLAAPVAAYWPEFAQAGKQDVPVRWLLSHRVGLPFVDGTMTPDEAFAWDPVIRALETQAPAWEPGTRHGYHATTYGYLVGEVIRRVSGRSVGTYLRDEIAGPLGLDLWIGLPAAEDHRAARLYGLGDGRDEAVERPTEDPAEAKRRADQAAAVAAFMGPDTILGKALTAPGGAFGAPGLFNSRPLRAAEVPAANMTTDARSVALLYAATLGEVVDDQGRHHDRVLTADQLATATATDTEGPDAVLLDLDVQFGLGFMRHGSVINLGGPSSFGHFGMGGSVGWADPDAGLTIGYVMNRLGVGTLGDRRSGGLTAACYNALA
jgi:CubicO group peptidase (beta-lactamase class C family)